MAEPEAVKDVAAIDFIDRSDVMDICFGLYCACSDEAEEIIGSAIEKIKQLPTSDVKPVIRGKWVSDVAYYDEEGCPCIVSRCNQCGEEYPETNYCPNCGADMGEL